MTVRAFDISGVLLAFISDLVPEASARAAAVGVFVTWCMGVVVVTLPLAGLLPIGLNVCLSLAATAAKLLFVSLACIMQVVWAGMLPFPLWWRMVLLKPEFWFSAPRAGAAGKAGAPVGRRLVAAGADDVGLLLRAGVELGVAALHALAGKRDEGAWCSTCKHPLGRADQSAPRAPSGGSARR